MRALAPEVRLSPTVRVEPLVGQPYPSVLRVFRPRILKSVPQRLKPSLARSLTARLNPCPSFDRTNLILLGQALFKAINKLKRQKQIVRLFWTALKFSRPYDQTVLATNTIKRISKVTLAAALGK
jgi:hypothetical protein